MSDPTVEGETFAIIDALGLLAAALNNSDQKSYSRGPMIQPTFRVRAT
jgi:hypothetical protein